MKQSGLFLLKILPPRVQYDFLFQNLPSLSLKESDRGRPLFPRDVLLKTFIYKALRRLKTLTDLAFEFQNPTICKAVGLDPYEAPPSLNSKIFSISPGYPSPRSARGPHPIGENISGRKDHLREIPRHGLLSPFG